MVHYMRTKKYRIYWIKIKANIKDNTLFVKILQRVKQIAESLTEK